ncbi:MAG: hypothetical protein Q9213_008280 [Squamulea squamosa]
MDNPTATALRAAWAEVLDVDLDEIEDDSNFVELGGDSVMALKLAEIAPSFGLDLATEAIFEEGVFSRLLAKTKRMQETREKQDDVMYSVTTDEQLIRRCAEACGLSPDQIEDIYPPSGIAGWFFTTHQESGAWLLQLIFQLKGDLVDNTTIACRAFEAIHDRNDTFRSRFVVIDGEVQNVVTKTPVKWIRANNLEAYKAQDRSQKVVSGQPSIRYGLIQEPDSTTYIVWTAMHSAMDGWTRKLLCDDLEAFLADPEAFMQKPKRPSMRKYLDFVKNMDPKPAMAFWDTYLSNLPTQNPLRDSLPFTGQPVCNQKITQNFPFQKSNKTTIRLSNMAHAAYAVLLGDTTSTTDVFFFGIRASRTIFPGAESIMGSVFSPVPIRIKFSPDEPIRDLIQRVQDDSNAMMHHEPFGGLALYSVMGKVQPHHSISFQWYPRGSDLSVRLMSTSRSGQEKGGTMQVVEEIYSPHTIAGCLNAYDDGDHITVQAEYDDRIFKDEFMDDYVQKFEKVLNRISHGSGDDLVESLLEP